MAQSFFTLRAQNAPPIVRPSTFNGGVVDLIDPPPSQSNNNGLPSLRLVVDYSDMIPNDIPGGLSVIVEASNNGLYIPIAYQFEPYRNAENGNQRLLLLQPNMNTYNDGIDSVVYTGGRTVARISRQQGRVGASFRVRVLLHEEPGIPESQRFQSVKIAIHGDLNDDA